ncbi:hypothetical protein ACFL6X_08175 [Candidatus Latescibacterota bacterium]
MAVGGGYNTFEDYAREETDNVLSGEKLLAPEQVMERWGITKKELQKYHRGEHPSGLFLPAHRFGKRTIRYRLRDVLRVEFESLGGH